ncbi:Intein C-terminal splicing region [uncultured Caudovirales phage]|uniref:DNA-directed DNA polymerase n=1 Tax=uncultured Caudovirales phage TaxID=2100421 RepID=A0A6J5LVB6_9CAUD|nr:Intein C-terminal splicing region [uncultured Caudovirales phage]
MAIDKKDTRTMGFMTVLDVDATTKEWVMPTSFPDLSGYREIAIDLETHDPNLTTLGPGWARKDGKVVGVAVAAGDDAWYFPFGHKNGPNLDRKIVLKWLQKQVATPLQRKIMHNAQYDLGWLWAEGVEVQGTVIDTMVVAAIVDENRLSYSLDNLAKEYCGMRKDEKLLRAAAKDWAVDPKKDMWVLPAIYVGAYAEQDARATLALWRALQKELEVQQLQAIFEIEQPLTEVLVKMRQRGVRVDLDKAEKSRKFLRSRVTELKTYIKDKSGVDIEPWAAASVQKVFDSLGLTYDKTETGQPSFTKMFLSSHPHEVAKAIVQLREMDKADSTFIDSILEHSVNGRIHCEFHQLRSDDGGTVTGRMCVHEDTLIETDRGKVRIVDVVVGRDRALTHTGTYRRIVNRFDKGVDQMVRLSVSSGHSTQCTGGHRVLTPFGWKHVRDLSVGDEIVGFESSACEHGTLRGRGFEVSVLGQAAGVGSGRGARNDRAQCSGYTEARTLQGTVAGRAVLEVVQSEGWQEQSDVWEDGGEASQLQGSADLRLGRVCSDFEAGVVYRTAGLEAHIRASGSHGKNAWSIGGPRRTERTPHRRGQNEQQSGQLGSGYAGGPSTTARTVTVTEIVPVGVAQVWDIEVETDHSYVAHGIVHHNSCSNPNLQQIPARDPVVKKLIRGIFVPEDGCRWGSFDYSSQEPRLLVHYCAILPSEMRHPMIDDMVAQFHAGNADLHQMTADIVGVKRKQAKTINLGIMYGMGVGKMADQLGISQDEAKKLLEIYHSKVPFVKGIADIASKQAEMNGKVRTVGGRLCRFPLWESRSFGYTKPLPHEEAIKEYGLGIRRAFTYKALNKLIQGSAADQTKKAMVDCMSYGLQPMLQVHDELCFNVESDEQAAKIAEIMENGINLMVPSKVDQDLQTNWGDVD